jgi:hypothetical protein
MSLDFYWLNADRANTPLVSLDERALVALDGAFQSFEKKTAIFVDPYGHTRIAPEQCALLAIQVGNLDTSRMESPTKETLKSLLTVLDLAASSRRSLAAEGD